MKISKNKLGYKILTPQGYVDFEGVADMGKKAIYNVSFTNGNYIEATPDHLVYIGEDEYKQISDLKVGDKALTKNGMLEIAKIDYVGESEVYDVLETNTHNFYANDILVHNCRFIGKSKTLIKSEVIRKLLDETAKKTYSFVIDDDVRFYKDISQECKYIVSLDPSMGVSGDFSAIQIFEFPTFEQVGEWMSDTVNQNDQVEKLKNICDWMYDFLVQKGSLRPEIYWTFENNTVGEGFLCALREKAQNDDNPEQYIKTATLISQIGNKRPGWTTTKREKNAACNQLKIRIEDGSMKINSKMYVQQLSNYTIKEVKVEAKEGNHDDLISASLLMLLFYLQECKDLELDTPITKVDLSSPDAIITEWLGDYMNVPYLGGTGFNG